METGNKQKRKKGGPTGVRQWGFLGLVMGLYAGLSAAYPSQTTSALANSAGIIRQIALPLCLVFLIMILMNRFLNPDKLTRYLGEEAGVRGLLLTAVAGILSVGPIYVWYPLLKGLQKRGASNTILATFLGNRSVKPFLIPVMISYFGWRYVIVLTVFTTAGAIAAGIGVGTLMKRLS